MESNKTNYMVLIIGLVLLLVGSYHYEDANKDNSDCICNCNFDSDTDNNSSYSTLSAILLFVASMMIIYGIISILVS